MEEENRIGITWSDVIHSKIHLLKTICLDSEKKKRKKKLYSNYAVAAAHEQYAYAKGEFRYNEFHFLQKESSKGQQSEGRKYDVSKRRSRNNIVNGRLNGDPTST